MVLVGLGTSVTVADEGTSPNPAPIAEQGGTPARIVPRRIVTIAPNSAEVICALGACERIVGVSKFCVYPPELKDNEHVGGLFDPDLEKIVALRPDLVVLRGRNAAVEKLCARLGVRLYMDKTDTLPGIETCITKLGRILGLEREAEALRGQFRGRLDAIRKRVSGRPRPRVMLTLSRQPNKMTDILTTGKGTFLDEMLDIAGGINVFGHVDMAYPQVGMEGIIAQRPDVIIELMPELQLTDTRRDELLAEWKQASSIPAVEHHRVFIVTDDNCLTPSPRYADIIEKISRLLHPEPRLEP